MKKKYGLKAIVASAMVSLALAGPAIVFSAPAETAAEIHISGARLQSVRMPDGEISIQAIFDVSIDHVINANGASFFLEYNPDYLQPSDMTTNQILTTDPGAYCDDFFASDPELYYTEALNGDRTVISPFGKKNDDVSYLDTGRNIIHMSLWLDRDDGDNLGVISRTGGESGTVLPDGTVIGGKIGLLEDVGYEGTTIGETSAYVVNTRQDEEEAEEDPAEKVTLGQLSFQVNRDHLAEMIDYFDGLDMARDHQRPLDLWGNKPWVYTKSLNGAPQETFLLDMTLSVSDDEDPWTVGHFRFLGRGNKYHETLTPKTHTTATTTMIDRYTFDFDRKLVVDVEATEPEVTVNAYQNFTHGDPGDLPLTMGRYSPTVTVTYADGTRENIPFPWGKQDPASRYQDDYTVRQVTYYTQDDVDAWVAANPGKTETDCPFAAGEEKTSQPVTDANYDPTHGQYAFSQNYIYTGADGRTRVFPKPVTAKLTVTPITVIDVTAQDLERSYKVTDVVSQVPDPNALRLPGEARIQTDIVPGGVSLTIDIDGWKPTQADSAWPTGTGPTAMNSLKADSYVAPGSLATPDPDKEGYPYWPDVADDNEVITHPDHFVGTYTFETSDKDHTLAQPIAGKAIHEKYPWLTVPLDAAKTDPADPYRDWPLDHARRHILKDEDFNKIDPDQYEVAWVDTVTEATGNGEATPDGRQNGVGQPTVRLSVAKKTGANFSEYGSMAADSIFRVWLPNGLELGTGQVGGGVTVPNWFNDSASGSADHVNGYYDGTKTGVKTNSSGGGTFFYLSANPDQPEVNENGDQRETLRRYINLGGWYQVAVCEDPGAGDHWSEPMPVYVPPRRNEYIESKTYNFLGENAGLYNWPGGVGDTLYFPRGQYDVVGPLNTSTTSGMGLPIYVSALGGNIPTDGQTDGALLFEEGNIHRLLPGVERYRESYGVKTLYDGQTGAQPGEIFNVKVKKEHTIASSRTWSIPGGIFSGYTDALVGADPVYRYGPTPLYEGIDQDGDGLLDGYAVAGFGRVFQPLDSPDKHTVTLRRQGEEKENQSVRIKLLSWEVDGITRNPANSTDFDNDNVAVVTYDTKQENYTTRQDFTLTIKNVGTTDIYGLDIDTVTDGYNLKDDGTGTRMAGGHFEMLQPPASFLPVGSTTTFTLTYVYDLPANEAPNTLLYRDTLYITANGHNDPGKGKQHDTGLLSDQYLLDFDAEFVVSKSPLHKVTVVYAPQNGNMGTANLIVGERVNSATDVTMAYTPTTRTYPKDGLVYVVVNKVDEYEVKRIHAEINGVIVELKPNSQYGPGLFPGVADFYGTASVDDPMKEVYVFQMPDHDVTVYVDFYEPFWSKLRLENLIDFSSPPDPEGSAPGTINDLKDAIGAPDPCDDHTYKLWRKTFTDDERAAAEAWEKATHAGDEDYYLMTQGAAIPHAATWPATPTPADEGQQFISKENQYIVVIDAEDDLSQVEAKIRRVVYHEDYQGLNPANYPNGYNEEIELSIGMEVYPYNVEKDTAGAYNWQTPAYRSQIVYDPATTSDPDPAKRVGYGTDPAFTGTPRRENSVTGNTVGGPPDYPPADGASDSSLHTSIQFDSPAKGESSYVVITLSAYDPEQSRTVERRYYLEIHRKTDDPNVELHYGNSPYGMIMNEDRFDTPAKQAAAKAAFLEGYTFEGQKKTVVPDAVWDHSDMHYVTYNREAWVRNRALFEPESLTGFSPARHANGDQQFYDEDPDDPTDPDKNQKTKPIYVPNKSVYQDAENLDLNDYAYFAILGETLREPGVIRAWDSSGRPVDIKTIRAVAMDIDWETNGKGLTLLDTTQTKQVARFRGNTTDFPILDLGVQGSTLTFLAEHQNPTTPLTVTDKHWPVSSQEVIQPPVGDEDPVTTTEYSLIEDIRPGRYAIVYSFTDFDGTTTLKVDRPFVILRGVGDVNTDGVRDNVKGAANQGKGTDEYHLEDRVGNDPLGYEAGLAPTATEPYGADYPFANIFKFRVCDVNNDRNVNHIDANQLDKNLRTGNTGWLRFYHPWEYGLD